MHFGQARLEVTDFPQPGDAQIVPADAMVKVFMFLQKVKQKSNPIERCHFPIVSLAETCLRWPAIRIQEEAGFSMRTADRLQYS